MVVYLVCEVLVLQSLIGQESVRIDCALGFDVSANLSLQVMLAAERNDGGSHFAATFQNAHYGNLVFHSAFGNHALPPFGVHETGSATDESFVSLNVLSLAAKFLQAPSL